MKLNGGSSSGRTASESVNRGSNPLPPAIKNEKFIYIIYNLNLTLP